MSATPDFVDQIYKDTDTGNLWRANSTTPGDWTLEVQNMQCQWEPTTLKLGEMVGYMAYGNLPGITKIEFLGTTSIAGFDLELLEDLEELNFPNLVSVDPLNTQDAILYILYNTLLHTVNLPSLTIVASTLDIDGNSNLSTLNLSSLVSVGFNFDCYDNPLLTTLNVPSLTSIGGRLSCSGNALTSVDISALASFDSNVDFSNNALTAASVENILHALVGLGAGYTGKTIKLTGGTNAAYGDLSVQGKADADALDAAGNNITMNGKVWS